MELDGSDKIPIKKQNENREDPVKPIIDLDILVKPNDEPVSHFKPVSQALAKWSNGLVLTHCNEEKIDFSNLHLEISQQYICWISIVIGASFSSADFSLNLTSLAFFAYKFCLLFKRDIFQIYMR